jgi:hypothetical protein
MLLLLFWEACGGDGRYEEDGAKRGVVRLDRGLFGVFLRTHDLQNVAVYIYDHARRAAVHLEVGRRRSGMESMKTVRSYTSRITPKQ